MKYVMSISVAVAALLAVVMIALSPQKQIFEWAFNRILDNPSYVLAWVDGKAEIKNLNCTWPERDLTSGWLDAFALSTLENSSMHIEEGILSAYGKSFQLDGWYSPENNHLVLQEGGKTVITFDNGVWTFTEAPIALLKAFGDFEHLQGTITKGFLNREGKGNAEIADLSYQEGELTLSIPKSYVEFLGGSLKLLGVDARVHHDGKPLWTINPLAVTLKMESHLPFAIDNRTTMQFTDNRFGVSSYLKNLHAEGSLKPAHIDLLTFDKSSIVPLSDDALLQLTHQAACNYKNREKSTFTLLGEEMCFECQMDGENTFALEFSDYLLEKANLANLPLQKIVGKMEKEKGLWKVHAALNNGKAEAYVSSLLLPEVNVKEASLTLSDWNLRGCHLTDVAVHYTPEKTSWKAALDGLSFQGSGNFVNAMDIHFTGGGSWESWQKVLSALEYETPFMHCPLQGTCLVTEGTVCNQTVQLKGEIAKGSLGSLREIHSNFTYADGVLALHRAEGVVDVRGKTYSFVAPVVKLGDSLEFDGWIADQGQEYVRLAGSGLVDKNMLHLKFDRSKTHLLNIVPDFFVADLKDWKEIDLLEFVGTGPFRTPFFEDLNRLTHHADWNIALFYQPGGMENEFQLVKGPLALEGTMKDLLHFEIEDLSLDTPFLAVEGEGMLDIENLVVQLDPIQFDLKFDETTALPYFPFEGGFAAEGKIVAKPEVTESWLEIRPEGLAFGMLSIPNSPFHLHQKGDNLSFKCNFVFNDVFYSGFDCLMNKQGLKAKNSNTSFFVGTTHFGIDRAGFCLRGRHSPHFALLEPMTARVDVAKAFLPFELSQLQGGTLFLENGHCKIRDTKVLGRAVDLIDFDYEMPGHDLIVKNLQLRNDGENLSIQLANLSFEKGKLRKFEAPLIEANNLSLDTLTIAHMEIENFASDFPFNTFAGNGTIFFTNLLPLLADGIRPGDMRELGYVDTKWFLPNQGEIAFEASPDHFLISDLKECYSRGKMIRFELNSDLKEMASLMWDGTVQLPLKLKPQHLSFKWSELFCLNVQGSVERPLIELKKR